MSTPRKVIDTIQSSVLCKRFDKLIGIYKHVCMELGSWYLRLSETSA